MTTLWRLRPQPLTLLLHAEGDRYEAEVVDHMEASVLASLPIGCAL